MQDMREGWGYIIIILLFTHAEDTRPRYFRIRSVCQIDNEILFMRILLNRNSNFYFQCENSAKNRREALAVAYCNNKLVYTNGA